MFIWSLVRLYTVQMVAMQIRRMSSVLMTLFMLLVYIQSIFSKIANKFFYEWYNKEFADCIYKVDEIDTKTLKTRCLYTHGLWDIFWCMRLYTFYAYPPDQRPNVIYIITYTDGRKYATKSYLFSRSMLKNAEISSSKKVTYLAAKLNDTVDITDTINMYASSLSQKNGFQLKELLIIGYVEKRITAPMLFSLIDDEHLKLNCICNDVDLTEIVYENNIAI